MDKFAIRSMRGGNSSLWFWYDRKIWNWWLVVHWRKSQNRPTIFISPDATPDHPRARVFLRSRYD